MCNINETLQLFQLLRNKVIIFTAQEDSYQKIPINKLSFNTGFKNGYCKSSTTVLFSPYQE